MKRLQFIILSLTMLCTGLVLTNIESYANDPLGISIDVDMNFDVSPVESFELEVTIEGVFTVYSCDLTLWPETEYFIIKENSSAIIYNITSISVCNKGSTETNLYVYTLRLNSLKASYNINDDGIPMKVSGGKQLMLYS